MAPLSPSASRHKETPWIPASGRDVILDVWLVLCRIY